MREREVRLPLIQDFEDDSLIHQTIKKLNYKVEKKDC